jgi:FkbM family methyltransferase
MLNGFDKMTINEYALAEKQKSSCIEIESLNKGHASVNDYKQAGTDCIPIQLRTMDDYWINVLKRRPVDFLKIDTEGYEQLVLRGGEAMFEASPPKILYLEWAPAFWKL